jgi:outer membrane protein OmpA-like peptidoglycan-associated protein
MKFWQTIPFATAFLVLQAQNPNITPIYNLNPAAPATVPLYRVTVVQGSAKAINYHDLRFSTKIDFKGTVLLPAASGVAKMKGRDGGIHISADFKNVPPASTFGSEFLTYVMWGISTEGRATNLGELILKRGKGEIEATEQLQTFGLVVTAEPYFAVSQPSNVVVMENVIRENTKGETELIEAKYELLKRGQYTLNLNSAEPIKMDDKTPFAVYQARNAVRIAQAAGASTFAPDSFGKAQDSLQQSETMTGGGKDRIRMAREAVQRAEDARLIAVQRQAAEQLALEQKLAQNELDAANREATLASAAQEAALKQTQLAVAQNAALQTKNAGLQSTNAGLQSTNAGLQTTNEGLRSKNASLRSELMVQLNAILQTRDTARGLIVNMSGVLFQNGKAVLLPAAREKLAKIAGILSTYKGLELEADGFTDSNGSEASNLLLSHDRALNTKNYLVSQGVPAASISVEGFGEEFPIASNKTDAGRKENRRVELVVSGEGITDPKHAGL